VSAAICGTAAIEGPCAFATIQIAKKARVVCLSVMVHVEVLTTAVRENCMQRIPLDADVVHQHGLDIEVTHKVLGPMTYVDSMMAIASTCVRINCA